MLQDQVVPLEFGNGLDSKTDPKAVQGKFLRVENGVFTAPMQVQKRPGGVALGTAITSNGVALGAMSSPQMTHEYNGELLAADQNLLLSYSSNQDAWVSKGNYSSVDVSRSILDENQGATGVADVAILNNYALYGWADSLGGIWGSVVDLSTGDTLVTTQVYSNFTFAVMRVKCVLLGATTLCIVYQKGSPGQYAARTVTFTGSGVVTFSAETVITTNALGPFDIVPTTTGGAFIYSQSTTPGVTVAILSTSLVITASASIASAKTFNVHISTTPTNNRIWAYWTLYTDDGAGNLTALTIRYAVYSSALGVVLAATNIAVNAAPYYVSNMITKSTSATGQTLYYGLMTSSGGGGFYLEYTNLVTITSAGVVGTPGLFAYGVIPASHSFTYGTKDYAMFYYRTSAFAPTITATLLVSIQPTLFILDLATTTTVPYVVARFASGVAVSYTANYTALLTSINPALYGSSKFYLTCGLSVQEFAGSTVFISGILAAYSYVFDFNSSNANIAKNSGGIAVLNGGVMQMYDGATTTELGFNLFPEITNITSNTAAGAVADGAYNYLVIYQWVDNQGNIHQSAPSTVKSITLSSGMPNQVSLTITTNFLSNKPGSSIAVYRTTGSGGTTSSIYYLVSGITYATASAVSSATVAFIDGLADASITAKNQPYTYPASSVLENTAPPPSMIMASHNNRLWFVDSEDPNTIWYTKSHENLVGLSPSGFLTQQIDPKFGVITGLAEMDDKLVIGKQSGFFVQSGDGADDTGQGSTLSFPQTVPSDVGISQFKGTITQPNGVMFKSNNGIYILSRSLAVLYIGADVESYNSQTITSATLVPGKSQIRFLCSTGLTLVYDYIFNKWSTFTNYTGTSSTAWNGVYVYAATTGRVMQESTTSYLDNATAYSLLIQTSWLSFASIQGFQRVKRLIVLGDYANGLSASHNLSIQAAYDFSTTFQTAVAYAFGSASTSGVFQYREHLPRQKCDALSLLIQETTTGSSLEYIDLTNISFEVGVKRGLNKLGGQQSVG